MNTKKNRRSILLIESFRLVALSAMLPMTSAWSQPAPDTQTSDAAMTNTESTETAEAVADKSSDPLQNASDPPTIKTYPQVRSFDDLSQLAMTLSKQPYREPPSYPKELQELSYDDYIKITFRPERATWWNQDLPFWLETFHRGFVQSDHVDLFTLNPINGSMPISQRITFSKEDFHYQEPLDEDTIPSAGHAGVRVVGRFPGHDDAQEMLTFVGSSYFRARSGQTVYGSSARGLAIDIALHRDEEFPDFRAFWIVRPEVEDSSLKILALLDSPSVAGAYRFRFTPGDEQSKTDVESILYFRDIPEKIALAPLTSMWMWGDGLKGPQRDSRPSVHDSDGLLIRDGDQSWRWRALARQAYPSVTSTPVERLMGFGVVQRNRAFYHYDDHNARYHERPSLWVTPAQPWTDGTVELLELPGAHEGVDNIAAYWVPDKSPEVGVPYPLRYEVAFLAGDPPEHSLLAHATNLDVERLESSIELKVRFTGHALRTLSEEDPPAIESSAIRGSIINEKIGRTDTGDWVLTANVVPHDDSPVELRFQLVRAKEPVSEQFCYLLPPKEPQFVYPAVYTRQE